MKEYIPLSGSTVVFTSKPESFKDIIEIEDTSVFTAIDKDALRKPITLNQLLSEKTETIRLSVDAALKLNIPFGSTDNKLSRTIFIQEYKKYNEIFKGNETVHFGISIRWIINIQKLSASANISSLPMVAASGQFNYVNASARFEVNGLSSREITALIPAPKDLTTETFVELNEAFMNIKNKIWEDSTTVTPRVLGIYGKVKENRESIFGEAVIIRYALDCISKGKTLNNSLKKINKGATKNQIMSVYLDLAETSEMNTPIRVDIQEKARKLLDII